MYKREDVIMVDVYKDGKLSKSAKFKSVNEAHKFIECQRLSGRYCHMECLENGRPWCKINYPPITDFDYRVRFLI